MPDLVAPATWADDVRRFLADHGLTVADVAAWISHPGGPKVIEAIEDELGLRPDALAADLASRSPRSATCPRPPCCTCCADTLDRPPARAGRLGLLLAMGPGFCSELVLLQW